MLVITPNGPAAVEQTYSLTCDLMGDESLDVPDVDNRFRWDRLTPTFQREVRIGATLSFTPLTVADAGNYRCINTITSPYLTNNRTHTKETNITLYGECFKTLCNAIIHNYYQHNQELIRGN